MSVFTLLVIEDDRLNMDLMERYLKSNSLQNAIQPCQVLAYDQIDQVNLFEILKANSAEMGLQIAANRRLDLILMDIGLPGMDGIAATHLLRAEIATENVPILAVTAGNHDRETLIAAGFNDVLAKPITLKRLIWALHQLIKVPEPSIIRSM